MNENGALDMIRSAAEEVKELEAENARLRSQRDALREALKNIEWRYDLRYGFGDPSEIHRMVIKVLDATKEPV
jgi:hypothetical protein